MNKELSKKQVLTLALLVSSLALIIFVVMAGLVAFVGMYILSLAGFIDTLKSYPVWVITLSVYLVGLVEMLVSMILADRLVQRYDKTFLKILNSKLAQNLSIPVFIFTLFIVVGILGQLITNLKIWFWY